jgi:hypothetical protein
MWKEHHRGNVRDCVILNRGTIPSNKTYSMYTPAAITVNLRPRPGVVRALWAAEGYGAQSGEAAADARPGARPADRAAAAGAGKLNLKSSEVHRRKGQRVSARSYLQHGVVAANPEVPEIPAAPKV